MKIRLIVADDTLMFRQALCQYINMQEDMQVVAEASNGLEALEAVRREAPDVVLMDIRMPMMDGVEATRRIKAELPSAHVITLTTFTDDEFIFEAVKAGSEGYLVKDMPAADLLDAIRSVQTGGVLIPPAIAARLVAEFNRMAHGDRPKQSPELSARTTERLSDLTGREREILGLVARGLSNQEIAEQLFLTEGTVKNYVSTIRSKLQARDRGQAIALAHRLGLVD